MHSLRAALVAGAGPEGEISPAVRPSHFSGYPFAQKHCHKIPAGMNELPQLEGGLLLRIVATC
jgi:hypothetical protein